MNHTKGIVATFVIILGAWMLMTQTAGAALTDFEISVDPATGAATLSWNGGHADVYWIDQEYECSFASASVITSVSSPWTDPGSAAQDRRFYRIARPDAPVTYSRTLGKSDLVLEVGYNLVSIPFYLGGYPLASEIVTDIEAQGGVVYELSKLDPLSGIWLTYDPSWPLVDFEVYPGEGFFLRMGSETIWTVAGRVMRWDALDIGIVYGYTQIGVPSFEYGLASQVAQAINDQGGTAEEVFWWDSNAGVWLTYDVNWPLVDFEVEPEKGLFVRAYGDSLWQVTLESGCEVGPPSPDGGTGGGHIADYMNITVIDEGTGAPINGAFVMVGDAPQAGDWNWGYTNASGQIVIAHLDLEGPLSVTAGDAVHSWLTLFAVDARDIVLPLKLRVRSIPLSTVSGDVAGFDISNGDDNYDAGFVVETLKFEQILTFDIMSLLAPDVERCVTISFIPYCLDVPGNVYAPYQWERILLRIYLDMTPYVLPLSTGDYHRMFVYAGRVNKDALVDLFISGEAEIGEIASLIEPMEMGITDNFLVSGNMTKNFSLTNSISTTMPAHIDYYPGDSDLFVVSLADLDSLQGNGELVLNGFAYAEGGGGPATMTIDTINTNVSIPSYSTIGAALAFAREDTAQDGAITAQVDRDVAGRYGDAYMTSPFAYITGLAQAGRTFSFSDPITSWSPYPDLIRGNFYLEEEEPEEADVLTTGSMTTALAKAPGDREYFWEFMAPGGETSVTLPELPGAVATPFRNPGTLETITFEVSVSGLTFGGYGVFDFNDFDFHTYSERTTHLSFQDLDIVNPY